MRGHLRRADDVRGRAEPAEWERVEQLLAAAAPGPSGHRCFGVTTRLLSSHRRTSIQTRRTGEP
ncbi:hypothetical protein CYQ11_00565 [Streptomyces cinnamoneus]|nr:hypothetical protein CYQ11_00565 [Streptomyces cinnamoneus]